jgi:O-antigen ligase
VLFVVVAVFAGAATAAAPLPAVGVAGGLLGLLIVLLIVRGVLERRTAHPRTDPPSILPTLLLCYLLPLFLLSRTYSLIGKNPIYLPDVLAMICAGIALGRARWRHLEIFAISCALIAVLMAHAVLVGREHHYSDAVKGLVLVLYPALAVPIAGWASQRIDLERLMSVLPRLVLPLIPIGLVVLDHHLVPSAFGLELGIAGAFAAVRGMPNRKILTLSFLAGGVILVAFSAKRGVTLTIFCSVVAAWIASTRLSRLSKRTIIGLALAILVSVFAAAVIDQIIVVPPSIPIVGRLAERASGGTKAASNNVTLRKLMWGYALTTTWDDDPLLGVGAYHPIEVTIGTNNIAKHLSSGVHNSFVGYTFYAGYPEGFLVVGVFAWGFLRLWRVRKRSIYAPAMFGALVAVVLTAATNVSFEVTYMGGPSWLALGLAYGLSAKLMDVPDPGSSADEMEDDGDAELALSADGPILAS